MGAPFFERQRLFEPPGMSSSLPKSTSMPDKFIPRTKMYQDVTYSNTSVYADSKELQLSF
jgi:hypothetical protein